MTAQDTDILYFDGTNWSMYFDASDVGILTSGQSMNSFHIVDADTILISFTDPITLGTQAVEPVDIVQFDATSLGDTTAGTFSMYFDGSDVGLEDAINEEIDALDVLPDGRLLISTLANSTLPGLNGADEDLLAFTPTALGENTSGTWAMYFDGSKAGVGLGNSAEDIDALDVAANGDIYLSAADGFAVSGISGNDEDVFVCTPAFVGGAVDSCTYTSVLYFDGSAWGLDANDMEAINLPFGFASSHSPLWRSAACLSLSSIAKSKIRRWRGRLSSKADRIPASRTARTAWIRISKAHRRPRTLAQTLPLLREKTIIKPAELPAA